MSIKILTQNSIQVTNIDGARENNFAAGNRSGIVKGAFNEGNLFSTSSDNNFATGNAIALDSCELLISGHRVVIDSAESITLTNRPSTNTRYSLVAEIVVNDASTPSFRLFIQGANTQLKQDNLYKTTNGSGTYQVEIGKFTLTTSGAITDVVRTIDVITGGKGNDDTGAINIGTITTNTLDSGMEAEVDVEQRFDSITNKTLTDFNFSIPKGDKGDPYVLTSLDKTEIAEETAELVSYVQAEEPENAVEGSLWIDTDEESDSVTQKVLCSINNGINIADADLTYSRGVVEVRKIGSIIWVIDSGVYNFTDSFTTKSSRTVFEFTLPKSISNCIHNTNGVYGTTGTISYFPALAYENVTYSTFNCQSYLKRSAIGTDYDTFQMVYTGISAISGGGLCGFHSKMPIIMVQQ